MLRLFTHALARLLPRELRDAHGDEIARDIDRRFAQRQRVKTFTDVAAAIVRERRAPRLHLPVSSRRTTLMSSIVQDLRLAARMFTRQPGFSAAVVVTLGLGIGSATAVISLADATLLRPVPAWEPHRLAAIRTSLSFPDYRDLEQLETGFQGILAHSFQSGVAVDAGGATHRVSGTLVSGNYFDVLGLTPAAGRLLHAADDTPGGIPSVVISHRLWRALGSTPALIGQTLRINARPAVLAGIVPSEFRGLDLGHVGDVWMPAALAPQLATGFVGRPAALTRDMSWLRPVGRLKPGVTIAQASAQLDRAMRELHPEQRGRSALTVVPLAASMVIENASASLSQFIRLLAAIAAVLLVLACANIANLLLARAAARQQEMGVRVALGAGRGRLMSQLLIESALLGAGGAVLGLAVAAGGMKVLGQYRLPGDVLIADLGLAIDPATLAAAIGLTAVAVLLFGLFPAWVTSRRDISTVLRRSSRTATRTPLGRSLVMVQVALSVALVGGGVLFARGMHRALTFDLGYTPAGAVMTTADPGLERLPPARAGAYIATALDRLRVDPSIAAAGASMIRPMRGGMSGSFKPRGYEPADPDDTHVSINLISDGWLEAVGIPIVRGRTFKATDRTAPDRIALVSESLARKVWAGRDPIGSRFKMDEEDPDAPEIEVAGIVGDARYGAVDAEPRSMLYLSLFSPDWAAFRGQLHFVARTSGDIPRALSGLRSALQTAEPRVPIFDSMTLEEHVAGALMPQRLGLMLLAIFATSALVLAAAGVYAVAAYTVSARTREIGIRMALGAGRARVLRQVVKDVAAPVGAGVAIGLGIQLATSRLAESFVFGLTARAPLQLVAASLVVIGAAALALALPARRAASIDPAIALRES